MSKGKHEIVTFKADAAMLEAMKAVPNRSDFIRRAILTALEGACPLCMGTGTLTPAQQGHWKQFSLGHHVEECDECNEMRLVCDSCRVA